MYVCMYVMLKDHKPDFINNPTCRLIINNPCKTEIGIISKNILDWINHEITQATKVNLWKSTKDTIEWFNRYTRKGKTHIYHLWCLRFLPIHIWRPLTESIELCLMIHHHHPTRLPHHHPCEKVKKKCLMSPWALTTEEKRAS